MYKSIYIYIMDDNSKYKKYKKNTYKLGIN
jgi:hypothetical protein